MITVLIKNNKVEIDVVIDKAYAKFVKKRFTLLEY